MKKKRIQSKCSNLELGKKLFYQCHGSRVCLDRNFGAEYTSCNIPKEIEIKWREDIVKMLEMQIPELNGNNKVKSLINYLQIVNNENQINKIVEILKEDHIDSFTRLQLCEMLSDIYIKCNNSHSKDFVKRIIVENIKLLQGNKIVIHDSYKECGWLGEESFSKNALSNRILKIQTKVSS